jgi:hypothetical protein
MVTKPTKDNKARIGEYLPEKHTLVPADIQPPRIRNSNSTKQE